MENTNKAPRITKAQRFTDIRAMLENQPIQYGTTTQDAIAFIENEIALIQKKNTAKASKPTQKDKDNENYRVLILDVLSGVDPDTGITCTDILKAIPEMEAEGFGNQKIAALIRPMVTSGQVTRKISKGGKAVFSLT